MATNTTTPVINLSTPFAFLPPDAATQFEASIYIFVACLSAYICEWILSVEEEITLLRKRGLRPAVVAYYLSRIGSVSYAIAAILLYAAPLPNCNIAMGFLGAAFVIAVPSTSAMFFFRLKAVYHNDRVITVVFGFLLVALFALSFLIPVVARAVHIGTTTRCINAPGPKWMTTPILLSCVFDTMVFLAISIHIVSSSLKGDTFWARVKSGFGGAGLPALSRRLLQGGQLYYCTTICLNIWVAASILAPVSLIYPAMFSVPNVTLASCMACRVFRAVKAGAINDGNEKNTTMGPRPSTSKYPLTLGYSSRRVPVSMQTTKTVESGERYSNDAGRIIDIRPYSLSADVVFSRV